MMVKWCDGYMVAAFIIESVRKAKHKTTKANRKWKAHNFKQQQIRLTNKNCVYALKILQKTNERTKSTNNNKKNKK